MASLEEKFATAQDEVTKLPQRPDKDTLLKLYSLYKQATIGDFNSDVPAPGWTDFVGRAKHDAWAKLKGKTQPQAMQEYVNLVEVLKAMAEDD